MGYTPEDEAIIEEKYQQLVDSCQRVCKSDADRAIINKAFLLAKEAHKGVRRKSGEPYILHPIAVAQIVVDEIGLGVRSVVAALLHDVVEDTDYTVEDIEHLFSPKIASMVDGLTKMSGVFKSNTSEQAENFRKMLLTLSDDVRVILIKIADRLHNMRTLGSMPEGKKIKIASETAYLFAPLAYRFGLFAIKTELEDLSLFHRFPEQYTEIVEKLKENEVERGRYIDKFNAPIIEQMQNSGIDFEISSRFKSIYSIWAKMLSKQIPFEEIYDLFAIRIVFKPSPLIPEKTQCWHIYSLITDIYNPKPDRIRDWVNIPKANGYEALHATVMGPDGVWAEVQIRSERMEEIAEKGFAAHWKYKKATIAGGDEDEFDKWLKKIREALHSNSESALEFLDDFKMTLYSAEIVVFTPKGEPRKMPKDATALDFAYDIHSKIGNKAVGAKINHKIESIYTPIRSGDQIEIITSENVTPKPEWLDHVTTAKGKQSIKNYLKKDSENNIAKGKDLFFSKLSDSGINPSARVFRKVLPEYECSNKDEFYSKVGAGIINLDGLDKFLRQNSSNKVLKYWTLQLSQPFKFLSGDDKKRSHKQVVKQSEGLDSNGPKFIMSECCNPIPGDDVMGFKDPVTGNVVVHKKSCDELTMLGARYGGNLIPIQWSSYKMMSFLSVIEVRGIDRVGILMDLAQVISGELNINIRELHIQSHDGIFEGTISLYVRNIDDLNEIIKSVGKIKGVEKIKRSTLVK